MKKVVPGSWSSRDSDLPRVVRITGERSQAHRTAVRLRDAGAVVLVIEESASGESAFCVDHQGRIAGRLCDGCGRPVCTTCSADAGGEDVCRSCRKRGRTPRARVRRRQLFVVFLFTVFLYEVVDYLQSDLRAVDPRGPVRVAIFQFVPPDQPYAPIVRSLNRLADPSGPSTSLYDIAPWFNAERVRYGGSRSYLDLDIHGPWGRVVEPPLLDDPALSAWEAPLRAWQYARYFHDLVVDQGQDPDDYAARVYVIYGSGTVDLAAHSRGSEQGRVAVVFVDQQERSPGYAALTVAHELAHTLGALDYYHPDTALAVHPEGFVEPYADPLYPQRFAELMAADIPTGARQEREVESLEEVRIGYATARDMGWIAPGLADVFYTPAAETPEDRLGTTEAVARPEGSVDGPGTTMEGRDPE